MYINTHGSTGANHMVHGFMDSWIRSLFGDEFSGNQFPEISPRRT